MRILAAFFAVLFVFINPTMILNVLNECELHVKNYFERSYSYPLLMFVHDEEMKNTVLHVFGVCVSVTVVLICVLHIIITALSLYGIYSCRPAFMRPMLWDAVVSLLLLLSFVIYSLYYCWRINQLPEDNDEADAEHSKKHLRNVYIGAAFLLTYFIWLSITIAAYWDVRKLHADFMYWIVEERLSAMKNEHQLMVSEVGSSKTSSKSSHGSHSRPNSAIPPKKTSVTHNRLSVPL
ncbi:hypothetical protein QR680_005305 [Steinernema hermaphroditum]|uniref:MARVEL domain-containing protein n=1 Tax=Steinernema hermaphroditum TaxID=289476 RepID=A0AA39HRI4_9BILA|nr:hypothetical protein QR680_005305 [Steinernema hermaphroditum]